jgi:hypothetical protein
MLQIEDFRPTVYNNPNSSSSHIPSFQRRDTRSPVQSSLVHQPAHAQYGLSSGAANDDSFAAFHESSVFATPRPSQDGLPVDSLDDLTSSQLPDLMPSESWLLGGHYLPKSMGRLSHHRESSLSSLGSAGPASPFSHNTSNPHIAVTDSASDGFADMSSHENTYYQLAKTIGSGPDAVYAGYPSLGAEHGASDVPFQTMANMRRPRGERGGLLPAPELYGTGRSHPPSVASSVAGDSPVTPSMHEPEDDRRRKTGLSSVPKLDRTMTDVYADELYSPNFMITSASPPHVHMAVSPHHDLFAQRLHAANSQHLTAAHSPASTSSRSKSPFRQGSPLAPTLHDMSSVSRLRFNSAQQIRDQQKAEQDAQALRQQMNIKSEPETPKTISPKDAMLEFHEPEGEANMPLFPPHDGGFLYDGLAKQHVPHLETGHVFNRAPAGQDSSNAHYGYSASPHPPSIQLPQHYPFIAQPRHVHDSSARRSSTGSSSNETPESLGRPARSNAGGGTYTCTYHGCALRFETPALLQKHKREGHRQVQGLAPTQRPDGGVPPSLMSQAGPHRCDRINPSTGKPCNTVFSRPYDLTRHEDTIHNARKQKVRCNLCTEEKTFSRADALTRHYRVCHPEAEFPGKHRRRGAH